MTDLNVINVKIIQDIFISRVYESLSTTKSVRSVNWSRNKFHGTSNRPRNRKTQSGRANRAGRNRGNPDAKALRLTAVVGGWTTVSFAYDRATALKRRRTSKGHASYCAHRAETIVAGSFPLDVPDHFTLLVYSRTHSAPCEPSV